MNDCLYCCEPDEENGREDLGYMPEGWKSLLLKDDGECIIVPYENEGEFKSDDGDTVVKMQVKGVKRLECMVDIYCGELSISLTDYDSLDPIIDEHIKINFCPMCGRRLN